MAATTSVPVEENVGTSYHPDVEYVDGRCWSATWVNGGTAGCTS